MRLKRTWWVGLFCVACAAAETDEGPTDVGTESEADSETETETETDSETETETDAPWPYRADAVVLPGVRVRDRAGARGPVHIVIEDAHIVAIVPELPPIPDTAQVLDVEGAWIVPGLIDVHVHLFDAGTTLWTGDPLPYSLRAQLLHGVTSVVDAGGPPESRALRDRIDAGQILGPSMKALGPFVTTPGSHPCELFNDRGRCTFVRSGADGNAAGLNRVEEGYDGVKIALADAKFTPWPTPRLPLAALNEVVDAPLRADLLVYAHVDTADDALDALDAGVTHLAHPPFGGELSDGAARKIAALARSVHTTLGAFEASQELSDDTLPWSDLAYSVPEPVLASWRADQRLGVGARWLRESRAWSASARAHLGQLGGRSATILPASDAGYLYVPHGFGLHRELERLADLGWTAERLLDGVTWQAAEAVGWYDRGAVEVGMRADLLFVAADPLDDLSVLVAPEQVMLGGALWSRGRLHDAELVLEPSGVEAGDFCLTDVDCASGLCDRTLHTCEATCDRPWALDDACGEPTWCAPVDGLDVEGDGVCHRTPAACDLVAPACEPAWYLETCVPVDIDTNTCWPSGRRTVGQTCSLAAVATTCEPGLFCSPIDALCYAFCDDDDDCPPETSCAVQVVEGQDWFSLCL